MSKYAGTKTEKNLMDAFAGESQARNKYTYYASVFDFSFLTSLLTISFETRYVTSTSATPATTSYITCCFVVNVDMNTAIAQIQKVVRIHCGTFLLPRMPI